MSGKRSWCLEPNEVQFDPCSVLDGDCSPDLAPSPLGPREEEQTSQQTLGETKIEAVPVQDLGTNFGHHHHPRSLSNNRVWLGW